MKQLVIHPFLNEQNPIFQCVSAYLFFVMGNRPFTRVIIEVKFQLYNSRSVGPQVLVVWVYRLYRGVWI